MNVEIESTSLTITPETYFQKRVEYKIDLYFKLSKQSKKRYYIISATSLILSAIVPVVINLKISETLQPVFQTMLPTVLSLLVTILVSLERLFQFRDIGRTMIWRKNRCGGRNLSFKHGQVSTKI